MSDRFKPAAFVAASLILAGALAGLAAISDSDSVACPRHPVGKATLAPCQADDLREAKG